MTAEHSAPLLDHQQTLYQSKNPTRRWLHCSRRDLILEWIESKVPAGSKAIEVGPGSGVYLPALARHFGEVLALDCETAYLENAQRLSTTYPNIRAQVDDITRAAVPSASADFILCSEVVEHIERSDLAIREMHRILKPGGCLLLSTPQRWSWLEMTAKIALAPGMIRLTRAIYKEAVLEMGHINLMTAATVRAQLEAAGFRVVEFTKSGLYFPIVAEVGGAPGAHLLANLERKIRGSMFEWMLWTQFYLARAEQRAV